jgi:hypothetical protein
VISTVLKSQYSGARLRTTDAKHDVYRGFIPRGLNRATHISIRDESDARPSLPHFRNDFLVPRPVKDQNCNLPARKPDVEASLKHNLLLCS